MPFIYFCRGLDVWMMGREAGARPLLMEYDVAWGRFQMDTIPWALGLLPRHSGKSIVICPWIYSLYYVIDLWEEWHAFSSLLRTGIYRLLFALHHCQLRVRKAGVVTN